MSTASNSAGSGSPKNSTQFNTAIAIALTSLLVGIFATYIFRSCEESKKLDNPEFLQKQLAKLEEDGGKPRTGVRPPALVRIDTANAGELTSIRQFHGKLREVRNTTISSEVSGLVLELPVEVGTKVVANETLLVRIDDTWTRLTRDAALQEIALTETMINFEQTEVDRLEPLRASGAISISEYLAQVNKVDQLKTNLEKAKIIRNESEEKLKRVQILAPFDGYVISKTTEVGSLLAPGTHIVQIISSGEIDAVVDVIETVIDNLKVNDEISVYIDPLKISVLGKVHSIVPYAPKQGARTFPVHIRFSDREGSLKSGMAVTCLVPESAPQPGIIVPIDAVMDKPDGRTVWVAKIEPADGDRPEKVTAYSVPVKLLASTMDSCSVVPETKEGRELLVDKAEVIIEGSERLTHGQVVTIKTVDPKYLEDLPRGSGHAVIKKTEPALEKAVENAQDK